MKRRRDPRHSFESWFRPSFVSSSCTRTNIMLIIIPRWVSSSTSQKTSNLSSRSLIYQSLHHSILLIHRMLPLVRGWKHLVHHVHAVYP
ncbi:hypothetical protein CY34DRAFT_752454 [Suillus luteus UH-Slu-Lm8-n1]|uniref:Uncharacterized protein n=1 Tax=Suillus luteus UH-Slu-Lm8-n1 TaxID=930992 RepID=A0A0D0BI04_9AGAM|nr:hypothetical protein CY34DRAFT_752454 [Suillus luteus UH-Slu-Lm8-n1]